MPKTVQYEKLEFIAQADPTALRDPQNVRAARSHAVSIGLARRRRYAQQQGLNFKHQTSSTMQEINQRSCHRGSAPVTPPSPISYLDSMCIDPFETLSINAKRLTDLLHLESSMSAGEPVFSINDAHDYQCLDSIFDTGFNDGALTAALGLTLCYAANKGQLDEECIRLCSTAIRHVQENLAKSSTAISAATMGSILLLLGIEYRIANQSAAQAHLDGVRVLLDERIKAQQEVPSALRRSIFWQDLFSSMFVGTRRIVQYHDFYPKLVVSSCPLITATGLPPGFTSLQDDLPRELLDIIKQVNHLYSTYDPSPSKQQDVRCLEVIGDAQANLEHLLQEIRTSTTSELVNACAIAIHLCVFALWTSTWNGALIPRHLSRELHCSLARWPDSDIRKSREIFIWLLCIGISFAIDRSIREQFDGLAKNMNVEIPLTTEQGLSKKLPILQKFIWSDVFYEHTSGWFWQRLKD